MKRTSSGSAGAVTVTVDGQRVGSGSASSEFARSAEVTQRTPEDYEEIPATDTIAPTEKLLGQLLAVPKEELDAEREKAKD